MPLKLFYMTAAVIIPNSRIFRVNHQFEEKQALIIIHTFVTGLKLRMHGEKVYILERPCFGATLDVGSWGTCDDLRAHDLTDLR